MRRRNSRQETLVSEPFVRFGPYPRVPVRPISVNSPIPQFRQLRLDDVICNQHEVVDLSLEQWHQMGMNEFRIMMFFSRYLVVLLLVIVW